MAQSPLLLSQVEQAARIANEDIARIRIGKWKADGNTKKEAEARAQSVQRNVADALPVLLNQARQSPDSVAANFKLYRNVKALYDEFATLSEYAGAFGGKDDYRLLGTDAQNLDTLSRTLADRVESLATQMDSQMTQLRAQAAQARAQGPAEPKKIIVDDNEPVKKKKTTKKKSAAKPTTTPKSPE
jgi:methionyl-tRNA synthetase